MTEEVLLFCMNMLKFSKNMFSFVHDMCIQFINLFCKC